MERGKPHFLKKKSKHVAFLELPKVPHVHFELPIPKVSLVWHRSSPFPYLLVLGEEDEQLLNVQQRQPCAKALYHGLFLSLGLFRTSKD